jgi:hypothetical protein
MRTSGVSLAIAAVAASLCVFASNAAADAPLAPTLLARITQPRDELALLGQSSGPFGLSRRDMAAELKFTNHDGYQFTVVAFGQVIALSVSNGREDLSDDAVGRFSTTTYLAHGRATPTSIHASFGDRGRIDLDFRPSGREIHASRQAGCRRPSGNTIAKLGLFLGELRFRGEGGYTSAETHRVHGGTVNLAALVSCRPGGKLPGLNRSSAPPRPSPAPYALGAGRRRYGKADFPGPAVPTHPSHRPKRTTLFTSLKLPLSRTVFGVRQRGTGAARFLAAEEASEGRIGIIRLAGVSSPRSTFTFDDTLANATVAPPAPFSGRGVFQQGIGKAESWTGSLAVSFLGAPGVPLTGSSFRTGLEQSW